MSHSHKKYQIVTMFMILIITVLFGSIFLYNQNKQNLLEKSKNNPNLPKPFKEEMQNILKMQQQDGTRSIMKLDCMELELPESIDYCNSQQAMFNTDK